MWETKVNPSKIFELRCKNTTYFGVGSIHKIKDILENLKINGINNVIFITGKGSYKTSGAWDVVRPVLEELDLKYSLYDKVGPNPTVDMIDEAAKIGRESGAKAVIGIGGGSPIDTAKSVAVLLKYTDKNARELYKQKFIPDDAVPIIAINLTHGTGTEVDRFAVATIPEKNYKPAIAYDCLYPMFAIDDPSLMTKLDKKQTIAVTVDALNHITEAATTLVASPYSILTAKETVRLIVRYLPAAVNDPLNIVARYYLLYASALAGISFDNGLLHLTHALEHPLSAVKPEIAHGLGLGAILPAVIKAIYPATAEVLADVYSPIVPGLKGLPVEAEYVAEKVQEWLFSVGCIQKLSDFGFTKDDIPNLVKLAKTTPSLDGLLSIAPVEATESVIEKIYLKSL
ncbi:MULTISPECIES: iron-containing alcohol dehydrogenase [Thermoanaerobacterium]|uniref:Iron-containing alcohol dehydrogenase n=2 Tax=Thermoanaerobacterium TaxID=28895 RepID=W9EA36_9THEO|nr:MULTISPECIES: iron-containing alcohol dehydrogenase [Thermoanaerobacterium]APG42599.1 alcohol dehydrogenase AdhA [Cloning vector pTZvec11_(adhA)]AQA26400.1 AdhA [synthetic construct]ASK05948.1 AdhA [Cloning vector pSH074]ASK05957.1 AdhA [Cloning vector pSH075]ASK86032.1 AdhA [Cloning vector pSH062]ASK86039.1 AdhA [Cloning vector pSH063]ASK86043.1 AdhA [Cloning vector pSH064]ASK86064.1 AdhA [Cloning vector pSH068]ASK86069.1 AdhA [Cloning vector pSH069]ASK86076.1 AdhA [Cloning vector pSH